jgi:hypothetical protein
MCHFYYTVQYITTIIVTQSVTYITLCNILELLYLRNVSLSLHCAIYQNYYTYGMCSSYCTVQYIRTSILMECVPLSALCNISELLYVRNVSLLLHCAIYQNYYTYGMCPSYYTVQYIRTIVLTECVPLIALCNIS